MSSPSRVIVPRRRLRGADDRVDQLGLTVAFDAGDPDDLASVHREGDIVSTTAPLVLDDRQTPATPGRLRR